MASTRTLAGKLQWNAELEEVIRQDPDDDARWSVLEDWILEQGDERAEVVRLHKANDQDAALRVHWQLVGRLLENATNAYRGIVAAVGGSTWRAGYITRARFDAPAASRWKVLEQLLGMRAMALATELDIQLDQPIELAHLTQHLAKATCARSLRRLWISAYWKPAAQPAELDASSLASLALDELRLSDRAIRMAYAAPLAKLRRLQVTPGAVADLEDLLVHGGFPALRRIDLSLLTLEHRNGNPLPALDHLHAAAPCLELINIDIGDDMFRLFLDRLAASPLAKTLKRLERRYRGIERASLPERHVATLGHLCA